MGGTTPPPRLVVGLGNPGSRYLHTRHNLGFRCIDRCLEAFPSSSKQRKCKSYIRKTRIAGIELFFQKPQTSMNLSGEAVACFAKYMKIPGDALLVIYDDLDLPVGRVRVRMTGGDGGHKGLGSIMTHLGHGRFHRLRIGIGRAPNGEPTDYVLSSFSEEEKDKIDQAIGLVPAIVKMWIQDGVQAAMNQYNGE